MKEPSEFDELPVLEQIKEHEQELLQNFNEKLEQRILFAIEETDWDEYDYCDIVTQQHMSEGSIKDDEQWTMAGTSVKVHRWYTYNVPPIERYYSEFDSMREVYRVTEERCNLAGIDPKTGVRLER